MANIACQDSAQQLQKEINWCVDQLRMGLCNKNPTEKQLKECERALKTLTSAKAPLVKKRQLMRQLFGDYRKKIEAEEKKWEKDTAKQLEATKISTVTASDFSKSFRKAVSTDARNSQQKCLQDTNLIGISQGDQIISTDTSTQNVCTEKFIHTSPEFKFNFVIDES